MRDRRQVPRYMFKATGRLVSASNQFLSDITFTTLSVLGCRVRGPRIPAVGQECQLVFELEGKQFQSEVQVMWKKPNGDAGLKFPALDESNLQLVRRLCATLLLEPLSPEPPEPKEE